MKRDFRTWILILIFGLPILLLIFITAIYFGNCGFNNDCSQASLPPKIHTPIPTLIPATLPVPERANITMSTPKCTVNAKTILSAWVNAGYPEKDAFEFIDLNGATCVATFADVDILFSESNLWYQGALACISCHHADLTTASAQMDLSSYAGIVAGSRRATPDAKGNDILGGGVWDKAMINDQLFISMKMPFGRPEGAVAEDGPTILAGQPKPSQ
jgi:hypothetical protein